MKQFKTAMLCIALAGLTIVACQKDDSISSLNDELDRINQTSSELERGRWVEKVSGSGHYEVCLLPDSCLQRTFTIQAQKDGDGNVSGNWTLISRHSAGNTNENHYHGSVECFSIDGNYARVGTYIDQGEDVGDGGFQFYDGGNPGAGNDSLSLSYVGLTIENFANDYCDGLYGDIPALRALEQGNIRIQTR